jgi:hypothetical protein
METNEAIKAFSQSEKLKTGIIWVNQMIEVYVSLPEAEKPGAERMLKILINMIGNELHVAKKAAPHAVWQEAEKDLNTAQVMMNSGVVHESGYHLTQALSKVTSIGQQSMSLLIEKGLL